jgi:hypothetical protein
MKVFNIIHECGLVIFTDAALDMGFPLKSLIILKRLICVIFELSCLLNQVVSFLQGSQDIDRVVD